MRKSLPESGRLKRYGVATACVASVFLLMYATWPFLKPSIWAPFIIAVMVSAWFGGYGPSLFAVVISAVVGQYFLFEPYGSFNPGANSVFRTVVFVVLSTFVAFLVASKRQAERIERAERRRFEAAVSSIGDAVIATDDRGCVTFMNGVAERLTGWSGAEAEGRPLEEILVIVSETTRATVELPVQRVVKTGRTQGLANHTILIARDGTERHIENSAAPIKDDGGQLLGVVLVFRDITDTKRTAEAVIRSEERLRALVTASSDVMYVMNSDWSEMLPIDGRSLVASNTAPLRNWMRQNLPPSEHDLIQEEIRQAIAEKRMFELEHRIYRPDGSVAWTHSRAVPMLDANGDIVDWFGMARDVTHRKQAEEEKKRVEAEAERQRRIYEAALSNTPDLVYVFGLNNRFLYANEALLAMWGRAREDAIGKDLLELGYEPWHAEMHIREIEQVVATKLPIRGEVPFSGTNGRRIYEYIFAPVVGEDGEVVAVAGTTRDMTERQEAEQAIRDQAEQLQENDRRKDEFLAMLAHELRNPLSAMGNAVNLSTRSGLQEHIDWSMEVITRQMKHLTRLIDDLLDVSRINRGKIELRRQVLDLSSILESAAATAKPLIEERKHTLQVVRDGDELWSEVDPTRIEQVVVNLLNNAAKYSDNGGHILLAARYERDEVVVSVRDRGVGIPADKLTQMFELFAQGDRSLARSEGGLGIGLTVVKRLVEMHGGTVMGTSEGLGKGSEFTVRLPRVAQPASRAPKKDTPTAGEKRTSRIVVVDDNVDTARGMGRLLKLLGHDVAVAYTGPEGIEAARRHRPDFVLLDIGLPGMDGYEVAARLREEDCGKNIVIIAISGYGQDDDRRRSKEAGFDHHLIKPLDHDALILLLSAEASGLA